MTTIHEPEQEPVGTKTRRIPRSITIITTLHTGRVIAYLAVTMAFVIGLAWVTALNGRTHELAKRADRLARENSALLSEFEKFRHVRSQQTKLTDIKLCEAINTITQRDRETFIQSSRNTGKILKLLGLSPAQLKAIAAASKASNARELRRRPLVKCGQLPTGNLGAAPSTLPTP